MKVFLFSYLLTYLLLASGASLAHGDGDAHDDAQDDDHDRGDDQTHLHTHRTDGWVGE